MMLGGGGATGACAKTGAGATPRPSAAMPPARKDRRRAARSDNTGGQQTQLRENPGLIMRFPPSLALELPGAHARQQRRRSGAPDDSEIAVAEAEIFQPFGGRRRAHEGKIGAEHDLVHRDQPK